MNLSAWPDPEPGTRWLIRLPNWIGDAVMVLPALRALPTQDQRFLGLAHPRALPVYRATGRFDELLPARGVQAPWELRGAIKHFAADRVILFPESFPGALMASFSGARLRLGRNTSLKGPFLTHALPRAERDRPLWRQYLELAQAAGGTMPPQPDFRLDPGEEAAARAREALAPLEGRAPVALAPGAAYGPAKRWPLERYAELARRLVGEGYAVIVVGGEKERALGPMLAEAGALDLIGRTSLLEGVAVLARARALVTNDSGALHLARAAGTRMVALFGSSSPRWTGPEPGEGATLWLDLWCSPCFRRRCSLRDEDHLRCLLDITVDRVRAALIPLLEGGP